MREETRAKLWNKLAYYPLLRLIVFSIWWRIFAVLALVFFACAALFLPKIWRSTPPDFTPVIKVSWLDYMQASSLRRTAERQVRTGQFDEALYSWKAAWANNPGNPDLARGWLRTFLQHEKARKMTFQAGSQTVWLLRLTHTNQTDLELAVQVLEKCRLDRVVINWLAPFESTLTPGMRGAYLKALFNRGEYTRFDRQWQAAQGMLPDDPELALYRAAYLAGWGPTESAAESRAKLAEGGGAGPRRVLANRLALKVSHRMADAAGCQEALGRLEDLHADTLSDHTSYWRLLAASGRKNQALEMAARHPVNPETAAEAAELAGTFVDLGMEDRARDLFAWHIANHGFDPDVCIRYAAFLIDKKDWVSLRSLALQIRAAAGLPGSLTALSYCLEGRAEWGERRLESARTAFARVPAFEFEDAGAGLRIAGMLLDLGSAREALDVLKKIEPRLTNSSFFWFTMLTAAHVTRDAGALLAAARKAYELEPSSGIAANNFAAALLINRIQPEEALKITLGLLNKAPNSTIAMLNHAAALLMYRRFEDAEKLLDRLDPARLRAEEARQYHLANFEVQASRGQAEKAWASYDKIDRQQLFPPQAAWIESIAKKLPPREQPSGGSEPAK